MPQSNLVINFDPSKDNHVKWLKKLFQFGDIMKSNPSDVVEREKEFRKYNLIDVLNENPLGVKPTRDDMVNFPIIHFSLAMKYTDAVFKGQAWIPDST